MSNTSTAERLARLRELEEQRSKIAAEQARETALLVTESRAATEAEIAAGPLPGVAPSLRREHAARQLIRQIAAARRLSPADTRRWVTWALAAPTDTPATFALLESGMLSERRARIVFDETALLSPEHRRRVDAHIGDDLSRWGDRKVRTRTRAAAQTVDPEGASARATYAATGRRVTLRPAPEGMAWLTALLPMAQAVACRASLEKAATTAKSAGDERGRGQVMADTLVERTTGQTSAPEVPLAVQLVITDLTLLGASNTPARLADGSPIPAPLARAMVLDTDAATRVRRLFCDPVGRLVTAETDARDFTRGMREFIALRDETCTTDHCDAPIRHTDHHEAAVHGGPTSLANGRGLCIWCNQTKADSTPAPEPDTGTQPTVPTRPPGRRQRRSRLEQRVKRRIAAAKRPRSSLTIEVLRDHTAGRSDRRSSGS